MGDLLPYHPDELLQLYIYTVPALRFIRSVSVFAVYPDDERSYQTVGARYDLEKSMRLFGLGVLSYRVSK